MAQRVGLKFPLSPPKLRVESNENRIFIYQNVIRTTHTFNEMCDIVYAKRNCTKQKLLFAFKNKQGGAFYVEKYQTGLRYYPQRRSGVGDYCPHYQNVVQDGQSSLFDRREKSSCRYAKSDGFYRTNGNRRIIYGLF